MQFCSSDRPACGRCALCFHCEHNKHTQTHTHIARGKCVNPCGVYYSLHASVNPPRCASLVGVPPKISGVTAACASIFTLHALRAPALTLKCAILGSHTRTRARTHARINTTTARLAADRTIIILFKFKHYIPSAHRNNTHAVNIERTHALSCVLRESRPRRRSSTRRHTKFQFVCSALALGNAIIDKHSFTGKRYII